VTYIYVKKIKKQRFHLSPTKKRYLAATFLGLGVIFLASAVLPILQFQLEYAIKFKEVLNPVSVKFYNHTGSVLGDSTTDYTQLNNWFVDDNSNQNKSSNLPNFNNIISYKISIPSLKVKDAVVELGSMDLKKSLIQYPQTAMPGQLGNPVIFGHSVLPQFFNPKSYLTIFATLFRLKPGDDIFIDYDKVKYKYKVDEMFEIKPTDFSVLDQRFDNRYLTLITCSPPGTFLRRLVIRCKLAEN
jgi:sortase A